MFLKLFLCSFVTPMSHVKGGLSTHNMFNPATYFVCPFQDRNLLSSGYFFLFKCYLFNIVYLFGQLLLLEYNHILFWNLLQLSLWCGYLSFMETICLKFIPIGWLSYTASIFFILMHVCVYFLHYPDRLH